MTGADLPLQRSLSVLLVTLTLFLKGALALECHSCVDLGDGGCSQQQMKKLTCPSNVHVCVETVAAVEWSHGKFSIGEKGCGLGISGTNDRAVEVHGILAFSQLHQCNTTQCNVKLDIRELELQPMDNVSARIPNGVECYSCDGDNCTIDNSSIVECYDDFRGCFHGNVTMKAGNFSLTKPIKGCVQDGDCTKVRKGSPAITLSGSCCSGNLCNTNLSNKTHFSTSIPRLAFLPAQETKNATIPTPSTYVRMNAGTAAASTSGKLTRSLGVSPSVGGLQKDHDDHNHDHNDDHDDHDDHNDHNHDHNDDHNDHNHDHNDDHDDYKHDHNDHKHDHNHEEDEKNILVQSRKVVPSVKVEERHVDGPKGGVAAWEGSALVTFLLLGLCL